MIYDSLAGEASIDQGDIIEGCPLLHVAAFDTAQLITGGLESLEIAGNLCRVVVVTQTCALANQKLTRAVVARTHDAAQLVEQGILKAVAIRGPIRAGRIYGWYFLPASPAHRLPEAIIDLRQLHTVRLDLLTALVRQGQRLCRIVTRIASTSPNTLLRPTRALACRLLTRPANDCQPLPRSDCVTA
jgi:hypothetical protein